jgi:hypothetical protein
MVRLLRQKGLFLVTLWKESDFMVVGRAREVAVVSLPKIVLSSHLLKS